MLAQAVDGTAIAIELLAPVESASGGLAQQSKIALRMSDKSRAHDIVAEHRRVLQSHLGRPADGPVHTSLNPLASPIVEG